MQISVRFQRALRHFCLAVSPSLINRRSRGRKNHRDRPGPGEDSLALSNEFSYGRSAFLCCSKSPLVRSLHSCVWPRFDGCRLSRFAFYGGAGGHPAQPLEIAKGVATWGRGSMHVCKEGFSRDLRFRHRPSAFGSPQIKNTPPKRPVPD